MLECVVNVSEGRRSDTIAAIAAAAGPLLLDIHTDADHHRSVLTLAGPDRELEQAVRAVAESAVARIDLSAHQGVHPRIGALDVVPFVDLVPSGTGETLASGELERAVSARNRFAQWAGRTLSLPCFTYGPRRSLPELRRGAFINIAPDAGPLTPHPTAGAVAVGARPLLVAYNVWLNGTDLATARAAAAAIRGPSVRALGLLVGGRLQVSCNLIMPATVGPAAVYDAVASLAQPDGAELVGLLPAAVLAAIAPDRWATLDLSPERTIEYRLRSPWRNHE